MGKCELKWCVSGGGKASLRVNENLGDESYNTEICSACAQALGLNDGGDLPDSVTVEKVLTAAKIRRTASKGKIVFTTKEGVEQLRPELEKFMSICFRMEPNSYWVSDRSSILDFREVTNPIYVKQLCWSQFGIEIGEETNILAILRKMHSEGRPEKAS